MGTIQERGINLFVIKSKESSTVISRCPFGYCSYDQLEGEAYKAHVRDFVWDNGMHTGMKMIKILMLKQYVDGTVWQVNSGLKLRMSSVG